MGTVGVKDPSLSVLTAEEDEIVPEVGHRPDVAWCEVISRTNAEPTVGRRRERVTGSHNAMYLAIVQRVTCRRIDWRRREAAGPHSSSDPASPRTRTGWHSRPAAR